MIGVSPSKTSRPRRQHYVPHCYLKQFVDPNTPAGQEPYVWIFDRNGRNRRRKAPVNIFTSTDLYTLEISERGQDYSIEQSLSQLESDYAKVFDTKITRRLPLSDSDHIVLCAFAAAMLLRTLRHKDAMGRFYDELIAKTEALERAHSLPANKSAQLRQQKENAHRLSLVAVLPDVTRLLVEMSVAFLVADKSGSRFITSDDPCNLFNPDLQWQRFYGPGLAQEGIEVTLPLSPEVVLLLCWSNLRGYVEIPRDRVEDLNRRTRAQCYQHFVSSSPKTRLIWFSEYPLDARFLLRVFGHKLKRIIRGFRERNAV